MLVCFIMIFCISLGLKMLMLCLLRMCWCIRLFSGCCVVIIGR